MCVSRGMIGEGSVCVFFAACVEQVPSRVGSVVTACDCNNMANKVQLLLMALQVCVGVGVCRASLSVPPSAIPCQHGYCEE